MMKSLLIPLLLISTAFAQNQQVARILNEFNERISLDYLKKTARFTGKYLLQMEIINTAKSKMNKNDFNEFLKWYYGSFFYGITRTVHWNLKGQYPRIINNISA